MRYLSIKGLGNEIEVFDDGEILCDKCSYPKEHRLLQCLSCNIFRKYSKEPMYFERINCAGKYFQTKNSDKPDVKSPYNLTWLIYSYKNKKEYIPYCVELLKSIIFDFLDYNPMNNNDLIICPVPDKENKTYQKAKLLAESLSKETSIKYLNLLKKAPGITKQHDTKNIEKKFKNIKEAFNLDPSFTEEIKGKTIFLIDDIVSTMASINECSKILKQYGAKEVFIFALGRNILPKKEKK